MASAAAVATLAGAAFGQVSFPCTFEPCEISDACSNRAGIGCFVGIGSEFYLTVDWHLVNCVATPNATGQATAAEIAVRLGSLCAEGSMSQAKSDPGISGVLGSSSGSVTAHIPSLYMVVDGSSTASEDDHSGHMQLNSGIVAGIEKEFKPAGAQCELTLCRKATTILAASEFTKTSWHTEALTPTGTPYGIEVDVLAIVNGLWIDCDGATPAVIVPLVSLTVKSGGMVLARGIQGMVGSTPTTGGLLSSAPPYFVALPSGVPIDLDVEVEQFGNRSADLDRDLTVCASDKVAFAAALGSTIADPQYRVDCDFDLDGDVDADDRVAFLALWDGSRCPADFNCDGDVNADDLSDFINAYVTPDPSADFNADGSVDPDDLADFITAFFATPPC